MGIERRNDSVRVRARRMLARKVSVAAMIEFGMWASIPYLAVGLTYAFLRYDTVRALEAALLAHLPTGSDIAGFGIVTALWPMFALTSLTC
jgi:hypothetical protein